MILSEEKLELSTRIKQLPLSTRLQQAAAINGLISINDLLGVHTAELEQLPGFNQELVFEFIGFMEGRSLGYLIDP